MNYYDISFKKFLALKENKTWLISALIIGVVYFVVLRLLYPVPSFYSDSFTWVGAAQSGQPVTFRPVGYSKMMMFFKLLSTSDIALIAGQYFSNLLINLFLFFTCTYFFSLKKAFKIALYVLLIVNPFYLFYSNYVSSDAFFNCFTVLWFTLLIWIMYKPSWFLITADLIVLAALFELRYNAIFFPAISTIALLLSTLPVVKKTISIAISFVLIGAIVITTTYVTKNFTGTQTFSAFSGWQLANNALHIMQHEKIDTAKIKDKEVKTLVRFTLHFFDTTRQTFPDSGATAVFMWHINSPLKRYMYAYHGRNYSYFKTWNAVGPIYNNFGKTVIMQRPFSYIRYFAIPNLKAYIFPPLEIYETYWENTDTIARVAQKFYHYKSNKVPSHHRTVYAIVFTPMQYLFIAANIIFIVFGVYYLLKRTYKKQCLLYNQTLLCFAAFYIANFFFIVLLAPSVIRYHIFILTLAFPILLYLVQQTISPFKKEESEKIMHETV